MKNNMPTQPVHDLKIQPREHDLIVATHGRGLYIADVEPLEELTPQVLAEEAHLFSVKSKVRWAGFNRANSSSSNYAGRSEPTGIVVNYYLRVKPKGEVKIQVFKGRFLVNEVNGTADPGLNSAVWNMTGRRERTPEEKRSIQEQAKRAQETGSGRRFAGDLNYASFPAVEGEYSFVLVVDGKTYTASASILKDEWYKD